MIWDERKSVKIPAHTYPRLHINIDIDPEEKKIIRKKVREMLHKNPAADVRGTKLIGHEKTSLGKKARVTGYYDGNEKMTTTVNVDSKVATESVSLVLNALGNYYIDEDYAKVFFEDIPANSKKNFCRVVKVKIRNPSNEAILVYESYGYCNISDNTSIKLNKAPDGHQYTIYEDPYKSWVRIGPGETKTIRMREAVGTVTIFTWCVFESTLNKALELLGWNMDIFNLHSARHFFSTSGSTFFGACDFFTKIDRKFESSLVGKETTHKVNLKTAKSLKLNTKAVITPSAKMNFPKVEVTEEFSENDRWGLLIGIRRRK